MASKHSIPPRGLTTALKSRIHEGRFGRMFGHLRAAHFGASDKENNDNLTKLADAMSAEPDPPTDGPDAEESGIPALYTYFGQFVDHDITFDPVSLLTKAQDPDGLVDFRTPTFDLDNVYGRGPDDQPYMYDGKKCALGEKMTGADPTATDLPRYNGRALIGDPRNDENSIVSQLQGLFHRFHNRMCEDNPDLDFERIQKRVRLHYQYVVLNDFLPRIVKASVLDGLKTNGKYDRGKLKFYHWKNYPFMPVEFSVACYRLGHSMIRPGYRLNDTDASLLPIFPPPGSDAGLTGFQTMGPGRAIDWGRFIDIDMRPYGPDGQKNRLQYAYRIDTSLVGPLKTLPPSVASDPSSLAARNLLRSWRLGLPSGQQVARAMYIKPIDDTDILIGKAVDKQEDGPLKNIVDAAGQVFAGNCPLWTYILAEAARNTTKIKIPSEGDVSVTTPQLGPVGGRIVAEVFLGMLYGDGTSLLSLDPCWEPATGPSFALRDIVNYALGGGPKLH
jgi:hypothetical protein